MSDQAGHIVFLLLLLVLPLSALAARRLPVGRTVAIALAWVAIFAVVIGVVMLVR